MRYDAANAMGPLAYPLIALCLFVVRSYPAAAGVALGLFLLRHRLPDPFAMLRDARRVRILTAIAAANPADARVRKELASLLLDARRPGLALRYVQEARSRCPDDPELLVLEGTAELRRGNPGAALGPLVAAVALSPGILYGAPFLVAGDALVKMDRLVEADDAYERFLDFNGSSLEGYYKLAAVRRALSRREQARALLQEARATWMGVPRFKKRAELRWWLACEMSRLWT